MQIANQITNEMPADDGPLRKRVWSPWTLDSRPWMGSRALMGVGAIMLVAAKATAIWVAFQDAVGRGTDPWKAAFVVFLCILPMMILEMLTLVHTYRLGILYRNGQLLGQTAWKSADRVCRLIYTTFGAAALGLIAAGWTLSMGMAIAAPLLAPMAPMMLGAGVIRILGRAIADGALLRAEIERAV